MKKTLITTVLLAAPFVFLSAQVEPGKTEDNTDPKSGKVNADSVQRTKEEKAKGKGKKEDHHDYRDTFNEHNKNKSGEAKDKKSGADDKVKEDKAVKTDVSTSPNPTALADKKEQKKKDKKASKQKAEKGKEKSKSKAADKATGSKKIK